MNQNYIQTHPWKIIEEGFDPSRVESSESIFSLGNGIMGQRANFEEHYSGTTFQGSYIGGVYYPDKTKVGWWKNGYPEYFAKVLNAPNWIGIDVNILGEKLDLNCCKILQFRRELDMQKGLYIRQAKLELINGAQVSIVVTRFLSLKLTEIGAIRYEVTPLNKDMELSLLPYVDGEIKNKDSNWEDPFWNHLGTSIDNQNAFLLSQTNKTHFDVCTFMGARLYKNNNLVSKASQPFQKDTKAGHMFKIKAKIGECISLVKMGGYVVSTHHPKELLKPKATLCLERAFSFGFDNLMNEHIQEWSDIWKMSDVEIIGDLKAQQGIRFNIYQLNQTYSGKDPKLNIGPKGFTGEKYGGSTYWDTEAYCIPFYMVTKNQSVARNLLEYRYHHLEKAIENAEKLGFNGGAALYPMVTINGEECHNEWEITFEEIHRNAAIAFAIYNYERYTSDTSYVREMGLEVLIGIARFWCKRVNFSEEKNQFVILGVTGPNEYENNVNNNWYTNYSAKWCLDFTLQKLDEIKRYSPEDYSRIQSCVKLEQHELEDWKHISKNMYFPYDKKRNIFLQQDGFLDKEFTKSSEINPKERPINQHWSWDKILRSPFIKQADVLQGFYFFEEHFEQMVLHHHFDFYEPFTVHESSLSPCIHAILAAKLDRMDQAYEFYLRTSRLDLDDYNAEVHEGLHITSMAGTWMSIIEGFGGMRIKNNRLYFEPRIPQQWNSYSFKINFRNQIVKINVNHNGVSFELEANAPLTVQVFDELIEIKTRNRIAI